MDTQFRSARTVFRAAAIAGLAVLAGCTLDRLGGGAEAPQVTASPTGRVTASPLAAPAGSPAATKPGSPPAELAGHWFLASPGGGMCGMTFGASENAAEGSIAPEGGCPGNFFTSRKWAFNQGSLVIRDHTGAPLAQLASDGPGRFTGRTSSGETISLAR